jgi:hypothetical protein
MITFLTSGRRKWYLTGGGGLLLIAAAALGLNGQFGRTQDPAGLPPDLVQKLQASSADPHAMRETMHETMQRTDLTDAQREEIMHRMREAGRQRFDKRVDEYMAAADDQKQAILDRQIDEMQAEMREHEERDQAEPPRGPREGRHRPDFASMTTQQRKSRSETRDPDRMARNMAYFSALRARAAERGIQMPHGPGPGAGGHGPGGPGGPRP